MLLLHGPRVRCCLALVTLQLIIYFVYVVHLLQPRNDSTTTWYRPYSLIAGDAFATLTYDNGEMNIRDAEKEEECVRDFYK